MDTPKRRFHCSGFVHKISLILEDINKIIAPEFSMEQMANHDADPGLIKKLYQLYQLNQFIITNILKFSFGGTERNRIPIGRNWN